MRLGFRFAALLLFTTFISLSSQNVSALSTIEAGRNTNSTLAQSGPRASFVVTSLNDSGPGTLREAITAANMTPEEDTITFQSGLTGTITLGSNLPDISRDLTITGPGVTNLTITATTAGSFTAFKPVSGANNLTISGIRVNALNLGVNSLITTSITLTDMVFNSMNTRAVSVTGGTLAMTRVTITGNVGLRAVYASNTTVTMTDSTISGSLQNAMQIDSGSVTITGSTFTNNTGATVGAIYANGVSTVTLNISSSTFSNNTGATAGAIYANGVSAVTLNISSSTFANNTGSSAGAIFAWSNPAAVIVNIINSTFSGNIASVGTGADAINASGNTTVDISFSTFSGHSNSTATTTGILHAGTNADIVLRASIIANNPAGGTPRECTAGSGATFTGSDNLTNDTFCPGRIGAPTNFSATLADNGGPTQTHALLAGSNAIDAYTGVSCPATDQRGEARPVADTDCDLGAYEIPSAPVCPTSPATIPAGNVAALIFAIECANASPSDDVINLTNSTYTLTATHNTASGSNGLPQIASAATAGTLTINGNGAIINGNNQRRALYVNVGANVTLGNLTITNCNGGGIDNSGTLTLNNVTVSNSQSVYIGGGIRNYGTLTLIDSTVSGNTAYNAAGGIGNTGTLSLTNSTVSGNSASASGGGIFSDDGTLTLTGSTISGNTANGGGGGGIFSEDGTLTVTGTTVSGNTAVVGGGILKQGGTLTLTGSTISGNTADFHGGGITTDSGTQTLNNVTISGNTASGGNGGGIINSSGPLTLNNVTVSANTASGSGDGIYSSFNLTLNNTILANTGEDCYRASGTVDANYTLFSNTSACGAVNGVDGNRVGADPLLGTLATAANGTSYYPLNFASPAIDAGSDALIPSGLDFDQAGNNRIRQTHVDMGAFESDFVGCPAFPATISAGDVAALIFAIECANASPSNDVINLTNSTYTLTATHNALNGDNGLPQIASAASAGTLTINGNGATINGNNQRRVLYVGAGADITLNTLTISGGYVSGSGGGIRNNGTLSLNGVNVTANVSTNNGGGIFNFATLLLDHAVITNNSAETGSGGGIFTQFGALTVLASTISDNESLGGGGGIFAFNPLTVTDSTIAGNTTQSSGGGIYTSEAITVTGSTLSGNAAVRGGGIHVTNTATLINTTITGNTDTSHGPGIYKDGAAYTLTVTNSTVTGNTSFITTGALYVNSGTATLNNSIFANNGRDCVNASGTVDANYTLFSNTNACGAVNAVDGNLVGVTPLLGTLTTAPNGTSYYPLNFASPAIDAGSDALIPSGLDFDQAGNNRIRRTRVDMGAFESDFVGCPAFPATIPAGDTAALILAIECANALPSNDVINLTDDGTGAIDYLLTATHNTASGANGLPQIVSAATAGTLTINGNGATISGNNQRRVIHSLAGADLTLNTLTISGGFTSVSGGGIYNSGALALTGSTVSGSTALYGGGIMNYGTLTLTDSTVSGNTANGSGGGGGIYSSGTLTLTGSTVSGNMATYFNNSNGGGIVAVGTVTLTDSTISGNTANASGGGIFGSTTLMTLNNSTVSGNTSNGAGGGFFSQGTVILNNSTVTGNTAVSSGGGFYNAGTLTLNNTILAINTPFDCVASINSIAITMRHSLIMQQHSCGVVNGVDGNLVGVDPLLGALTTAPNGTSYHPLLAGSPAINSGSNALVPSGIDFDQAGNVRIQGGTVDMGAFETDTPAPAPEIDVTGNSVSIADGDTSPSSADHTDFGTTTVGTPVTRTFTIHNTGTGPLTISSISLPSGFSIANPQADTVVAAGGSTALNVQCEALSFGVYTGIVSISSDDADEDPYTFTIACQVDHAVPAGITVTETSGSTGVAEGGVTDTYTVALDRVPSANVTVTLNFNGQITANGSASPVILTFTPVNWETAQTVTVAAVNDSLVEGAHSAAISYTVASADADYNGLTLTDTAVSITDNDTAIFAFISPSGIASEGTSPYLATVALTISSDPAGGTLGSAVSVDLNYGAVTATVGDDFALNTSNIGFGAGSSSGASQLVDVNIVDDAISEPDETFTLLFGAVTGPAAATGTHGITILDNDEAGITISETGGTTAVTEAGDTDTVTVALDSQPAADVAVTLTFGSQLTANGSASPVVLTFTPVNWETAQTVTVAAVNDSLVEGAHSAIISQSVSSADADYNVIDLADISVSIADNDTANVIFPSSAANIAEDFTPYSQNAVLSITSDPAGGSLATTVTAQMTQTAGTALTPDDYTLTTASLTFPAGSVNGATQLFSVDIVDDALEEPDETFVLGFGTTTGPATATGTHTVTILANDAPVCPTSPATIPAGDVAALILAIECANASVSNDVINLSNSIYTLTATHASGLSGLPVIEDAATAGTLTINGNGATISGNSERRVLHVASGADVNLGSVTISGGYGGAIYNAGDTAITSSLFTDNFAGQGGALNNDSSGTLTLTNSTVSGNEAFYSGGGIFSIGTLTINNSTIAANDAFSDGGGDGLAIFEGALTLNNSIVANRDNNCFSGFAIVEIHYSLFSDAASCGAVNGVDGNIVGVDPMLGTLTTAPNGTSYYPLLAGSPAINSGDNALVPVDLDFDQAGNVRIQGGTVDRGAFETGTLAAPEIDVTGNGVSIADGDTTPVSLDHTDFGMMSAGTPLTRIFTIHNTGSAALNLGSMTVPTGFSVIAPLPGPVIAAGASAALNLQCDAVTAGLYGGTVTIPNDDADENPYNFDIICWVEGPEIEIYGNAQIIANGDTTPSLTDGTDFGTTVTGMPAGQTFTVRNFGTQMLTLGTVNVPTGFSVVTQPSTSLMVGLSTSFTISCDAETSGTFSGTASLTTNDADENPFTFAIACEVLAPDINITGNGITIANGDVTPDLADHTDFGVTMVGVPVTRTFTIENTGSGTLNLTGMVGSLTGFIGDGSAPATTIPEGGSTTFGLVCEAHAAGTYGGTFGFTSNDPDESPYTFAVTCSVEAPSPDISITGNGVIIANGDITPSLTDHTDFGSTPVGTPVTRTFTIHNSGDGVLQLTNSAMPSGFMPAMPSPETTIAAGSSTSFGLQCPAAAVGIIGGLLTIESDDPDTPAYAFAITCDVTPGLLPDINITGNGVTIANNDFTPDLADHTDFGVTTVGVPVMRTFTIENTGSGLLNLIAPVGSLSGMTIAGDPPAFTIPAGGSTTLSFVCEANAEGTYGGTFGFTSNDPDESPYTFAITCQVDSAPPAGITVTESGGTTGVAEAGGTDTYTVVLASQPTADVVITLTFNSQITVNGQASPVALTFDSASWNIPQTVTVAAVNDSLVEGAHSALITQTASSADAAYNAINPNDVTVSIADNDTASFAFANPTGSVSEGTSPYLAGVVLTIVSNPVGGTLASDVMVDLNYGPGTATVGADFALNASTIGFGAGTGNGASQQVDVNIVNDLIDEPDETFTLVFSTVTGPATASGTHEVTILDDDAPAGITVTESGGSTSVAEAGGTDTYTVVLNSQPTADVEITLTFNSQITVNGQASPVALTFDSANWNIPQTVTVAAVNDSSVEGAHSAVITQSASSADAAYNAINPNDVTVSIADNDTASIAFANPTGSVSEGTSPYLAGVVLTIVSDPVGGTLASDVAAAITQTPGTALTPADYALNASTIGFGAGTGNGASQQVDVNIVNDLIDEPDETFTLVFSTVTGPATASGTHEVTILDDDAPAGITITESGGSTGVAEAGGTDTYTVVLNSQPTADVVITLTFNSQITVNGQASPVALTFDSANWNIPQTVTVAAVNDSSVEGAHSTVITQSASSADAAYNAIDPADVTVSIADNDTASIAFATASGTAEEGISPYTVSTVLTIVSDPVGGTLASDVAAAITQTPGTALTPADYALTSASVTFPAGAASGAVQAVSVDIVDDALPEGDETFELSFGAAAVPASGTHAVTILASDLGNLLKNPGFEGVGTGITKANKWESSVLTAKDGRVCNTAAKTFSNSGECAFRFQYSGILNGSRVIKQKVVDPAQGVKGERYTFDAMISAQNLTPGAKLIVQVKYANGTKAKAVINVPSGSYGYTAVETVLPITRKVEWVLVKLVGGSASGRLLIDDLVLWVEPGTPATGVRSTDDLLPLPAAPDGFRSSSTMP